MDPNDTSDNPLDTCEQCDADYAASLRDCYEPDEELEDG